MKRFLTLVCLGSGLRLFAQDAPSTNDVTLPRPIYRYLFLIDTSISMSRQKTVTLDTVHKLILDGIGGRIQTGDAFGVWTFDDQFHTNVFPVGTWDPHRQQEDANRVYRFLRDQRFNKKKMTLEKPMAGVAGEAALSDSLTAFVFTDGTSPMKGTPFDDAINEIFSKHAQEMRKARKPFVVVFVVQDGKRLAHAVSPGGGPIYIPRIPKPVQIAKTEDKETQNATASTPSPKKPLTVDEISAKLLQSSKTRSNTTTSVQPARPVENPQDGSVVQPESGKLTPQKTETTPPKSESASTITVTNPPPSQSAVLKAEPSVAPAPLVKTETTPPSKQTITSPLKAKKLPTARQNEVTTGNETLAVENSEAKAPASTPPQTIAVLPVESGSSATKYLLAGVALLLLALMLVWLYTRNIRYVPRPSLISRSMDKDKKS